MQHWNSTRWVANVVWKEASNSYKDRYI